METKEYLSRYYENYDENSRLLSKHGMVEYITTMKYVEKYLQPGMRILEIGAATGRYSHALAQKGYPVDAVELVEHNIEIFKKNTAPGETVTLTLSGTSDGYATKIGNEETVSGGFDFKLTNFDADYVYIGMFAARNADVTFSNIKLIVDGKEVTIK